jgi:hypothetical protein
MRKNKNKRKFPINRIAVSAAVVAAALVLAGGCLLFARLKTLWEEQCLVTDVDRQIEIRTGSHIKPGVVRACFGLCKGVNLAAVDFAAKRAKTLETVPNIRSLVVERHLPDRVTIVIEERIPVARMNVPKNKKTTGRVVDADGVIFLRQVDTKALPVIYEAAGAQTRPGRSVSGQTLAALRLVKLFQTETFADLDLVSVDTTRNDYLFAMIQNGTDYVRAKIAWDGMTEASERGTPAMTKTLENLRSALRSRIGEKAVLWVALSPNRIYADTQEPIQ